MSIKHLSLLPILAFTQYFFLFALFDNSAFKLWRILMLVFLYALFGFFHPFLIMSGYCMLVRGLNANMAHYIDL